MTTAAPLQLQLSSRGSAPNPGSSATRGPYAPLRSVAGAPCAPPLCGTEYSSRVVSRIADSSVANLWHPHLGNGTTWNVTGSPIGVTASPTCRPSVARYRPGAAGGP
jgi:hypothetical protein